MFKTIAALTIFTFLNLTASAFANTEGNETGHTNNYHFEATLTEGNNSIRRVELPWKVVSNLLQKDLKDLQVYNADDQAIPFSIRKLGPQKQDLQEKQLSFFPMGEID